MELATHINRLLGLVNLKVVRVPGKTTSVPSSLYDLGPESLDGMNRETRRILNILNYTKSSGSSYDADEFQSAYHSITIGGRRFTGQRDPGERLRGVPFDFSGATVLDIGCNQGGMLLEVADQIKHGIGVDFDSRMVNAANSLRSHKRLANVEFFVFDVEKERLDVLRNFLPGPRVDVVFLLSVCMWIANWRQVISFCANVSDTLVFESNGNEQQQVEQEEHLKVSYRHVQLLRSSSPDDPNQKLRKLYFCKV